MSGRKKHIKVKDGADKTSVIQGTEPDKEGMKELYFKELRLYIQSHTFDTLYRIKQVSEVDVGRAISFLLDAGGVLYTALEEKMEEKLKEIKEKE